MKLLVVEDEKELRESIAEGLRASGYAVDTAGDGRTAEDMCWTSTYDLVLLDINLPGMNGFSLLEKIRQDNKLVNVIMLTARGDIEDRVKGLDLGANDYVIKPFYFEELEARIRSLLRRKQVQENPLLTVHGLTFDMKSKHAYVSDERIHLTGKETGILEYLLLHQDSYVSQEELMEHVWEDDVNMFSNAVRVHMSALRNKLKKALGKSIIRNELGRGYIIESENER